MEVDEVAPPDAVAPPMVDEMPGAMDVDPAALTTCGICFEAPEAPNALRSMRCGHVRRPPTLMACHYASPRRRQPKLC